jgi:hypothetical protein
LIGRASCWLAVRVACALESEGIEGRCYGLAAPYYHRRAVRNENTIDRHLLQLIEGGSESSRVFGCRRLDDSQPAVDSQEELCNKERPFGNDVKRHLPLVHSTGHERLDPGRQGREFGSKARLLPRR